MSMEFTPHAYQTRAIEWIKDHPKCCLFLDMGLGKTVSTLTAVRDLIDEAEVTRVLVVAPKKVAESTWAQEAGKWSHLSGLRVSLLTGTEARRKEAMSREADIYVVGRDNVVWLFQSAPWIMKRLHPFDCIVVDELTSFKSHTAKRFRALRRWTAVCPRVIGLTGTPVPNSLMDLWAEMYTVDGGERLGRFIGKYREAYFSRIPLGNFFAVKYVPLPNAERAVLDRIADICLTMRASDYLELPDLNEVTVRISLPDRVMERYRRFERDQVMAYIDEHGEESVAVADSAAGLLNKLAQFANGAVYAEDGSYAEVHDEKLEHLAEIVEQAGSPVLVFYQYRHDAERIRRTLEGVRTYEGDDDLRDWNDGKIRVLLAHPASCAYGLNMQGGGHYIVWFGTGWNLEQYQQANARLHRQGQTHPVTAYRLVCEGTADETALAAIDRKAGTQDGMIETLKQLLKRYEHE
jgi:SNF2 family DNA or RNA helicase